MSIQPYGCKDNKILSYLILINSSGAPALETSLISLDTELWQYHWIKDALFQEFVLAPKTRPGLEFSEIYQLNNWCLHMSFRVLWPTGNWDYVLESFCAKSLCINLFISIHLYWVGHLHKGIPRWPQWLKQSYEYILDCYNSLVRLRYLKPTLPPPPEAPARLAAHWAETRPLTRPCGLLNLVDRDAHWHRGWPAPTPYPWR